MFRRRRFAWVIKRQLELFERDQADLIGRCVAAERSYDGASRDDAEEHYGAYLELVEEGTEALADLRNHFASSLEEEAAGDYEQAFNRAVAKRLSRFALEVENR